MFDTFYANCIEWISIMYMEYYTFIVRLSLGATLVLSFEQHMFAWLQ